MFSSKEIVHWGETLEITRLMVITKLLNELDSTKVGHFKDYWTSKTGLCAYKVTRMFVGAFEQPVN